MGNKDDIINFINSNKPVMARYVGRYLTGDSYFVLGSSFYKQYATLINTFDELIDAAKYAELDENEVVENFSWGTLSLEKAPEFVIDFKNSETHEFYVPIF